MARHHMRTGRCLGPLAATCLFCAAPAAWADGAKPEFNANLTVEIADLVVFEAQAPEQELNDASATIEGDLSLVFPGGAGLRSTITLEPATDAEGDRFFQDFGLYAEELHLFGPIGEGEWRIGKFNLDFGLANDAAPTLFGDEIVDDYELTERIGVAVEIPLVPGQDEPALTAAVFTADSTPLSDSVGTRRGRLHRRDGGVSNTGAPDSAMLGLAGNSGGTAYSAGLRYQSAGRGDEADEYGGVLGLTHEVRLAGLDTVLLGEAAYFPHFDGEREPAAFVTLGAAVALGEFALSAVLGQHWDDGSSEGRLATVELDYELSDTVTISAGYRFLNDEGQTSHSAGLQLTFEFQLP